ncbi:TetR/AcrR family transcriptional regulator [Caldimonas brevitalea]|uniref:Transcriptional regulator, TetR family n=1 Tax=Caldimonas brevitalea TaxID=413882 RepID=A0A0G3BP84_9BURK|nr:TetR/AcrR family transcriptional regulator [Caldimonas brevitalea]AKJ28360.1 transcriptional regulator, TetR family [Caldimonas brevitalea]
MPSNTERAAAPRSRYHHGALRQSLIDATEALLAERGVAGFSLREVARRLGVSPAAPAHHFGDAQGLLTAVATLAFEGLTEALEAGNARGGADPVARLREQGVGYVRFALRYPGRFGIMFRTGVQRDREMERAGHAAFQVLEDGVRSLFGIAAGAPLSAQQRAALMAIWSVVHGFAHLMLAGEFDGTLGEGGREAYVDENVGPMLQLHLDGLKLAMQTR